MGGGGKGYCIDGIMYELTGAGCSLDDESSDCSEKLEGSYESEYLGCESTQRQGNISHVEHAAAAAAIVTEHMRRSSQNIWAVQFARSPCIFCVGSRAIRSR